MLRGVMLEVYNRFYNTTEVEMWNIIKPSAVLETKNYIHIFEDLIGIQESEKDQNISRTEGGVKMIISQKVERDTRLRNQALSIHGYECMVCKFSFEAFYGAWGKDWAEVHHLSPIHKSKETKVKTNPLTDLVVLCANCHRMIHRKNGLTLTIDELKNKILKVKVLD